MTSEKRSPEERGRRAASWRRVLTAFFVTFLAMVAAIYWIIRTGKF